MPQNQDQPREDALQKLADQQHLRELEQFHADTIKQQRETHRRQQLHQAFQQAGANEKVIDLLIQAVPPLTENAPDQEDYAALVNPLKQQYAGLFATPQVTPVPVMNPPSAAPAVLTKDRLQQMSFDEINEHWSAVSSLLARG